MKTKKGISLIVLVITVIVLTILTGAIIVTVSNANVIEQSNDAVGQFNIKAIEEIITTAWADQYLTENNKIADLEKAVYDALDKYDVKESDYEGYEIKITTSGAGLVKKGTTNEPSDEPQYDGLNHSGVIPEGGVYYTQSITEEDGLVYINEVTRQYNAGDNFPATVNKGDKYVYGGYTYTYGYYFCDLDWENLEHSGGWHVDAYNEETKQKDVELGQFLHSINGVAVNSIRSMLCRVSKVTLTEELLIPDTVKDMSDLIGMNSCELNGTIVINHDDIHYGGEHAQLWGQVILTGTSTLLDDIADVVFNGDATVVKK